MSYKAIQRAAVDATNSLSAAQFSHEELQKDIAGFERLATLLKTLTGINLPTSEKNISLMAGRIGPVMRRSGIPTYFQYAKTIEGTPGSPKTAEFINALTTNTTEFFRESKHYEILRDVLKAGYASQEFVPSREMRVWCAAASTGQEPYTMLMTILESLPNPVGWDIRLLATDIDTKVLNKAMNGLYSKAEAANVPPHLRQKYFEPETDEKGEDFLRVRSQYRQMVRYATLNLLSPFPFQHKFDVIFCRNVLIYFEPEMAVNVVRKMTDSLRPGGYLFLGHSETAAGRNPLLKSLAPAVYRKIA